MPNIHQVMQESVIEIQKLEGKVVKFNDPDFAAKLLFNRQTMLNQR